MVSAALRLAIAAQPEPQAAGGGLTAEESRWVCDCLQAAVQVTLRVFLGISASRKKKALPAGHGGALWRPSLLAPRRAARLKPSGPRANLKALKCGLADCDRSLDHW